MASKPISLGAEQQFLRNQAIERIQAGARGHVPYPGMGGTLSLEDAAKGIPVEPGSSFRQSIDTRTTTGINSIAEMQELLEMDDLTRHKALFDPDTGFLDKADIQTDRKLFAKQLTSVQKQLDIVGKQTGLSLNMSLSGPQSLDAVKQMVKEGKSLADLNYSLNINISDGNFNKTVRTPFGTGVMSSYGSDIRIGNMGSIVDLGVDDVIPDFPRAGNKVQGSIFAVFNEAVQGNIIKTLRQQDFSGAEGLWDVSRTIKESLGEVFTETYESSKRLNTRSAQGLSSLHDFFSLTNVIQESLTGKNYQGYKKRNFETIFKTFAENLSDATSPQYKIIGGITEADAKAFPDAVKRTANAFVVKPKAELENLPGGRALAQYNDLIAKKIIMTTGGSDRVIRGALGSVPEVFAYDKQLSKIDSVTITRALTNTVPFESSVGEYIKDLGKGKKVGVSLRYETARSLKTMVDKMNGGTHSSLSVKHLKVVGGIDSGFMDYLQKRNKLSGSAAAGFSMGDMSVLSLMHHHDNYTMQTKGVVQSMDDMLRTMGLPSQMLQAEGDIVTNTDVDLRKLTSYRDSVTPYDMKPRKGQMFNRLINSGAEVTQGQTIGFFEKNGKRFEEVVAKSSGILNFQDSDNKIKAIISSPSSLLEQPSIVIGAGSKGTIGSAINPLAQQLMESDIVKKAGKDGLSAFALSNMSLDKENLKLKGLMLIPDPNDPNRMVVATAAQEDLYTRQVDQMTNRKAKVSGPDRVASNRYFQDMRRFGKGLRKSGLDKKAISGVAASEIESFLRSNNLDYTDTRAIVNNLDTRKKIELLMRKMGDRVYNTSKIMNEIENIVKNTGASPFQSGQLKRQVLQKLNSAARDSIDQNQGIKPRGRGKILGDLDSLYNLTNKGGSMDKYGAAIQKHQTNSIEMMKTKYRDSYLMMNNALVNGKYGQARMALEVEKRFAGMNSPESRLLRGGFLMASPTLPGLPSDMINEGVKQGTMIRSTLGNKNKNSFDITKRMTGLFNVENLRKESGDLLNEGFDDVMNLINPKNQNRGLGLTSFHFGFDKEMKGVLSDILADTPEMSASKRAIGKNILDRGLYIASNDMLGLGNLDSPYSGQFLRQRERLIVEINRMVQIYDGQTQSGSKVMANAFRNLINVVGKTSSEILDQIGSEKMMVESLTYKENGMYGAVMGDIKQTLDLRQRTGEFQTDAKKMFRTGSGWGKATKGSMGKKLESLAEDLSILYVNEKDYLRMYGSTFAADLKAGTDRFAFLAKHPKIALSSETVRQVRVAGQLLEGKIGVNDIALEMMKSDKDMDAHGIIPIDTDTHAGRRAAELGLKRTNRLNKEALRYYGFDLDLIKTLKRRDDINERRKFNTLTKDLQIARATSNTAKVQSIEEQLRVGYKPGWYKALMGAADYGMETGILTNQLNQFNAVVLRDMSDELKGLTDPKYKVSKTARRTASFLSALNFVGEAKIRAFKSGSGDAADSATDVSDLLRRLLNKDMRGGAPGVSLNLNVNKFTSELTDAFMGTFGFNVSSYLTGKDEAVNKKLLRKRFGNKWTESIFEQVAADAASGKQTYMLNAGKQAVMDEAFGDFLTGGDKFRFIQQDKVEEAVRSAVNVIKKAESGQHEELAHTLKMAKRPQGEMTASQTKSFLADLMNGKMSETMDGSDLALKEQMMKNLGLTSKDVERIQGAGNTQQVIEVADKPRVASASSTATGPGPGTSTKLANSSTGDIMGGNWLGKMTGGIKGGMAGALVFGVGAAVGSAFGAGSLPPISPIPKGEEIGSVNQITPPQTYLRDESGYDTRSRVSGDQSIGDYLVGFAASTGRDANISMHDHSMTDKRYMDHYESRVSGRF